MTKGEIVRIVAQGTGLTRVEATAVIDGFLATVTYALKRGESVAIRDFGTFKVVNREARIMRNPRTREMMSIPRRKLPVFRPAPELRKHVSEGLRPSLNVFDTRSD